MSVLSERLRPGVEAAAWVIEAVKQLEIANAALASQVGSQRQLLHELILGMEIMTTNARVLCKGTEPVVIAPEGSAA